MTYTSVVLGDIALQDFEVPEKIEFGGAQRVIVHELIGGGRVVDALGGQPQEVSFSGFLSGATAVARAQALEIICTAGEIISLSWQNFYYRVIVADFFIDYEKSWWMPFTIRCAVVQDSVSPPQGSTVPISNLIAGDLAAAAMLASSAGFTSETTLPTASAYSQVQVVSRLAALGNDLIEGYSATASAPDCYSCVASINQLLNLSASLAAVAAMNGYINRAASNSKIANL